MQSLQLFAIEVRLPKMILFQAPSFVNWKMLEHFLHQEEMVPNLLNPKQAVDQVSILLTSYLPSKQRALRHSSISLDNIPLLEIVLDALN